MSDNIDINDLPNYKIFWVDNSQHKNVVLKFNAKNDNEALDVFSKYENSHADHIYYYGKIHYVTCLMPNKKKTIREVGDLSLDEFDENKNFVVKILNNIGDFFTYSIWQKLVDIWYKAKDIIYLLKHNEARSNQWNLDLHLLDTIELNVPSLIKYSHCMCFIDDAILEMHKDDKDFDLKKYHESHCAGYPENIEKRAMEIQNQEYNKLLLNVKLYKYYSQYGIIDSNNADEVAFDKEWRYTLPIKSNTYDEFDYAKLTELCTKTWNDIWDWVKKYGHTLSD